MYQFCCVAPVPDRTTQATAAASTHPFSSFLSELLNMQRRTTSFRSLSNPSRNPGSSHSLRIPTNNGDDDDDYRLIPRSKSLVSEWFSRQLSIRDHREVVINDIVGNGISGILYKWVNYGRGWRPRWFVLQDGVLSYFKIHGPDKITINHETERGSMVIGEDSIRRLSRRTRSQSRVRKPVGEIHLKVQGTVQDKNGKTLATLIGKWDESMHYVTGDNPGKGKGSGSLLEPCLLWRRSKPSENPTRYNLTRFAITLNEITPGLEEKLPPTDSRLRPDQRYLENGEYEKANVEKLRLEQRQRQARGMQEKGWKPRWFEKDSSNNTYHYIGGYWEAREKHNWESCPNIFGQLSTDQSFD